jgi:hypothetical protein
VISDDDNPWRQEEHCGVEPARPEVRLALGPLDLDGDLAAVDWPDEGAPMGS